MGGLAIEILGPIPQLTGSLVPNTINTVPLSQGFAVSNSATVMSRPHDDALVQFTLQPGCTAHLKFGNLAGEQATWQGFVGQRINIHKPGQIQEVEEIIAERFQNGADDSLRSWAASVRRVLSDDNVQDAYNERLLTSRFPFVPDILRSHDAYAGNAAHFMSGSWVIRSNVKHVTSAPFIVDDALLREDRKTAALQWMGAVDIEQGEVPEEVMLFSFFPNRVEPILCLELGYLVGIVDQLRRITGTETLFGSLHHVTRFENGYLIFRAETPR